MGPRGRRLVPDNAWCVVTAVAAAERVARTLPFRRALPAAATADEPAREPRRLPGAGGQGGGRFKEVMGNPCPWEASKSGRRYPFDILLSMEDNLSEDEHFGRNYPVSVAS
ncbi:UNVERIFIED_CONTAM: hypothetical protein K2H54_058957 [Gekko kuhli]